MDALDHDQLLASGGAGDEAHGPAGDPELLGQDADEGLVGGPFDGRGGDTDAEGAVHDAVDSVGCRSWCESDGEADVGICQDYAN